jgi:hypothetical protein
MKEWDGFARSTYFSTIYMFSTFKFLLNRWMNNDTDTVSTCACKKIPEFVAVVRLRSGSYREKRKKTLHV